MKKVEAKAVSNEIMDLLSHNSGEEDSLEFKHKKLVFQRRANWNEWTTARGYSVSLHSEFAGYTYLVRVVFNKDNELVWRDGAWLFEGPWIQAASDAVKAINKKIEREARKEEKIKKMKLLEITQKEKAKKDAKELKMKEIAERFQEKV